MSGCETKVPALRFKGYPGAWEKNRLGEIFSERQTRSVHGELLSVSMNSGVFPASQNGRYDNSSIENGNYKCVAKGDMAYNSMRMWQGACGASAYDGLVSPAYTVASPHEDADSVFFEYSFKRDEMLFAFRQHSQGLTSDTWNLKFPLFSQIPIHSPALSEQQQIGSYFRSLDALIAGREKAHEKLEALKKSMLLKMFPQGDATVPEVRFKGFAGEWEKKRLGDVAKRITRKNTKLESELPLTISAEHGLIDQYEFFNNRVAARDVSGYYLVCRGEFAYNKSTSDGWPWGVVKQLKYYPMGVLSTLYIVFAINEKELDAEYVEKYFETTLWHYDVSIRAAEGARNHGLLNITASDFLETTLLTPSLPEQQKIGAYFRSLDALLAARREEIGKLKQMKKALLERMFV